MGVVGPKLEPLLAPSPLSAGVEPSKCVGFTLVVMSPKNSTCVVCTSRRCAGHSVLFTMVRLAGWIRSVSGVWMRIMRAAKAGVSGYLICHICHRGPKPTTCAATSQPSNTTHVRPSSLQVRRCRYQPVSLTAKFQDTHARLGDRKSVV